MPTCVLFDVGGQTYGVAIEAVQSIERMTRVTRVPGVPRAVLGLIPLRGELLPILDLPWLLGLPAEGVPGPEARVLVLASGEVSAAVAVDKTRHVVSYDERAVVQDTPASAVPGVLSGVVQVDGRWVGLVHAEAVLAWHAS